MKQFIITMLLLASVTANAQKDVTKFLGIPVDGTKTEMKKKLIDKGFTYNSQYENFEGEFNGQDVNVYIATNNNKVWRIMVSDANPCNETEIKIRFNNLCKQFAKNQKYITTDFGMSDFTLSDKEDISYEMLVHKKRYQAGYYQVSDYSGLLSDIQQKARDVLLKEYTQEQIDNPSEEQAEEMKRLVEKEGADILLELLGKRLVWFIINEKYGKYYITMYYDNEYNHSNGEDL